MACLVGTAARLDYTAMRTFGLVDVFPTGFFVGLATLMTGFVLEIFTGVRRRVLAAYTASVAAFLFGIAPLTAALPRYTWTYKHVGVTRLLLANDGTLDRSLDVYNNWSGLFGLAGAFSELTGLDPLSYAAWSEPLFAILSALAVTFLARSFFTDDRIVAGATMLGLITNWVGQFYFAPQSAAYPLCILMLGLASRHLCNGPALLFRGRQLGVSPRSTSWRDVTNGPRGAIRWARENIALYSVVGLFVAVTATHQLSPLLVLLSLSSLVIAAGLRPLWLPIALGGVFLGWFYLSRGLLQANPQMIGWGASTDNAESAIDLSNQTAESALISAVAKGLSATIWLLALLAALIAFSRRRIDLRLPTLLIAPFLVLGASSYGGEAIYRVYLFTIPAAAVLISWLLFAERRSFRIVRAGAALAVCLGITAAFVVPYFGREHLNRTSIEELALYDYVATATEPGSVVVYFSLNYPSRSTANYGDHIKGPLDIALLEVPNTPYRTFTPDDATGLAYSLFNFGTAPIYLIASESQREAIDTYGLVTPSTFDTLVQQFDASGSYRVVFANTAGKVFQVLRPGIELPAT